MSADYFAKWRDGTTTKWAQAMTDGIYDPQLDGLCLKKGRKSIPSEFTNELEVNFKVI